MPPRPVTPKKMAFDKYRPFMPRRAARPHLAGQEAREGAPLVLGRPARRQPGPHRSHGPRAQAAHVRDPRRDGLQGDRGRLPLGVAARLRLRAPPDRGGPGAGRRDDPGADPVPSRADPADLRVPARAPGGPSSTSTTPPPSCSGAWCSVSTSRASSTSPSTRPSSAGSSRRPGAAPTSFYEYSPESYTGTEVEFAVEICEAVMDVIEPDAGQRSS